MQASFGLTLLLMCINLMPLATAGLGSGVVLGFASQSVLANVVAGCNLVRPKLSRALHFCAHIACTYASNPVLWHGWGAMLAAGELI